MLSQEPQHTPNLLELLTQKRRLSPASLSIMEEKTEKKESRGDRQAQQVKMGDKQSDQSHHDAQSTRGTEPEADTEESNQHIIKNESSAKDETCLPSKRGEDDCKTRRDAERDKCKSTHNDSINSKKCEHKSDIKPVQGQHAACKYEAALKNKALAEEKTQQGQDSPKKGEDGAGHANLYNNTCELNKAERIEKMLRERAPSNLPREWLDNIPHIAKQLEDKIGANEDDGAILQKLRELAMFVSSHPRRRKRKRQENTILVQPKARLPQQNQHQQLWQNNEEKTSSPEGKKTKTLSWPDGSKSIAQLSTTRQRVCLHQQQRLLLLRHAQACPYGDGRCPKTEHCRAMKRLWKHILDCKNRECLVPHCVSSRYVLSHYYKCRDTGCNVCVPVKDAIRRGCDTWVLQEQDEARSKAAEESEVWPSISMGNVKVKISIGPKNLGVCGLVSNSDPKQAPSLVGTKNKNNPKKNKINTKQQSSIKSNAYSRKGQKFLAQSEQHAKLIARADPVSAEALPKNEKIKGTEKEMLVKEKQMLSDQTLVSKDIHGILEESKEHEFDPNLMDLTEIEPLEVHIATFHKELQLSSFESTKCRDVLKELRSDANCWLFDTPIDPVALDLQDYPKVISHPMDLGTVQKRLDVGLYQDIEEFKADVHLTFDNAMLYNEEGSKIHCIAKELKDKFTADFEGVSNLINNTEGAHVGGVTELTTKNTSVAALHL